MPSVYLGGQNMQFDSEAMKRMYGNFPTHPAPPSYPLSYPKPPPPAMPQNRMPPQPLHMQMGMYAHPGYHYGGGYQNPLSQVKNMLGVSPDIQPGQAHFAQNFQYPSHQLQPPSHQYFPYTSSVDNQSFNNALPRGVGAHYGHRLEPASQGRYHQEPLPPAPYMPSYVVSPPPLLGQLAGNDENGEADEFKILNSGLEFSNFSEEEARRSAIVLYLKENITEADLSSVMQKFAPIEKTNLINLRKDKKIGIVVF